jgi:hypothetical protein
MIPIMIAFEAADAKAFPCSKARKKATGPEVNGRPMSQPPTIGLHLLLERLTRPMNIGTRSSLRRRIIQSA